MKHCGDITKLSGYTLPPVDCITGGSPCQDLSVAGKRAGLEGERSGLFMEQVRIVKEMRERDRLSDGYFRLHPRPRFMVWENVPGAFSSNKGKDFQAVLTEIVRVVEPGADDVPMPENGRWPKSGCLYDDMGRWSIAWRVHDAQFWGVPQRRKRIALVADFGGLSAPEVCFERKGMQWYPSPGTEAREETAAQAGDGAGRSGGAIGFTNRGINSGNVAETLRAEPHGTYPMVGVSEAQAAEAEAYTLKVRGGVEIDSHGKRAGKGALVQTELSGTLGVSQDQTLIQIKNARADGFGETGVGFWQKGIQTLRAEGENRPSRPGNVVVEDAEPGKCLNPWDVQSKHIQPEDGVAEALYAGECRGGGGESYVFDASRRHDYQPFGDVCETVQAAYGTGGNNQPIVVTEKKPSVICMATQQGGAEIRTDDTASTLTAAAGMSGNTQPVILKDEGQADCGAKAYSFDSLSSNSMKSKNPYSGCREVEVAKTIDCFDPNPSKNQGGIAIVQTATIRAEVGDDQAAVVCAGFDGSMGAKAGNIGYEPERSPTLTSGKNMHVLAAKETDVMCLNDQGGSVMGVSTNVTGALRAEEHGHQPIITMNPRPQSMCTGEDVAATLGADDYKEPQMVYDARGNGDGKIVPTLTGDHQNRVTDYTAIACQKVTGSLMASGYQKNGTQEELNGMYVMQNPVVSAETFHCTTEVEKVQTLKARDYKDPQIIACTQGGQDGNGEADSVVGTIEAVDYKGPNAQYVRKGMLQMTGATVRRLTPLECERLQGYPDGWTDIGDWTDSKGKVRNATDSARYKALGNSIALPYWSYLLRRISAQYERPATLGSLFDGISGFPLIWARCNGPKYCLWTSEIEEFPIAVCKKHFGDEETGEKGDLCDYLDKF